MKNSTTLIRGGVILVLLSSRLALAGSLLNPPLKEKFIMGWLESVFLRPCNIRLTAKLDSGAKTSSLHAYQIEHFRKNNEEWVRFTLIEDGSKKPLTVERPLVRTAYIKEHKAMASKRDVVKLLLCKNGMEYETEFTLVDRSNFNYPLLLGRSFLKDVALVDSDATFIYKAENDPCLKNKTSESGFGRSNGSSHP